MVYAGMIAGLCFDGLLIVARLMRARFALRAALDLCFGLVLSGILIPAAIAANYGELRLFLLVGAGCGALLYAHTLAPLLRMLLVRPARAALRALRRLSAKPWSQKIFR